MKERPIIFSAPMVRALLAGTKTQTRRLVRLPKERGQWEPTTIGGPGVFDSKGRAAPESVAIWNTTTGKTIGAPYDIGARLWVKETHAQFAVGDQTGTVPQCVAYRATCDGDSFDYVNNGDEIMRLKVTKWTPSIYMPRWASRLTLEIGNVRVERLNDISEDDAKAEGVEPFFARFPEMGRDQRITTRELAREAEHRASFACLWDEINGDRALWSTNPWVWAITLKRVET